MTRTISVLAGWILLSTAAALAQAAAGTEFTYQGRLSQLGVPVTGTADIEFRLWDSATLGLQIGLTQTHLAVNVADGLFTVTVDFGEPPFNRDARWLEISVRHPAGGGGYTTLSPRQPLTAVPYAIRALYDDVGVGFSLPYAGSTAFAGPAFSVTNTGPGQAGFFTGGVAATPALEVLANGTVAIKSVAPLSGIALLGLGSVSGSTAANVGTPPPHGVRGDATAGAGTTYGVHGTTASSALAAAGVYGAATSTSGAAAGVEGVSNGPTAGAVGVYGHVTRGANGLMGVFGLAEGGIGVTRGVFGQTDSVTNGAVGTGGLASRVTGVTFGVEGVTASASDGAAGVSGLASAVGDVTYGVLGETRSDNGGAGVFGLAIDAGGLLTHGVKGENRSTSDNSIGVYGWASAGSGATIGVQGRTNSTSDSAKGVFGLAAGATGNTRAVYGNNVSSSANAVGVEGIVSAGGVAVTNYGVKGTTTSTDAYCAGVGGFASVGASNGVYGENSSTTNAAAGVWGNETGTTGITYGVAGQNVSVDRQAAAVIGIGNGAAGPGMPQAAALEINNGAIRVTGPALTKAAGTVTTGAAWSPFKSWVNEDCNPGTVPYHCHSIGAWQNVVITNNLIIAGQSMIHVAVEGAPPAPGSACHAQILSTVNGAATVRVAVYGGLCCNGPAYTGTVKVNYLIINP